MASTPKPILLAGDSRLLFWRPDGEPYLGVVRQWLAKASPAAAYVGASNGDAEEFYEIFVAAMESIGVDDCRHIPSELSAEDRAFVEAADLILLAGGDVRRGWETFHRNGLDETIPKRYGEGAVLIGVSAGAVHLGKRSWPAVGPRDETLFATFRLVPFVISAHEGGDWPLLRRAVELSDEGTSGIGVPAGGGAIYRPDHTLEPVRRPVFETWIHDGELRESILMPDEIPETRSEVLEPTEIMGLARQH